MKVLEFTKDKLDETFKKNVATITEETNKSIEAYNNARYDAQRQFKSFYNRKTFIDILIYINLVVTPILALMMAYVLFFKK